MLYDYTRQAWVSISPLPFAHTGQYMRCGHLEPCTCYGTLHEGQRVDLHLPGQPCALDYGSHAADDCIVWRRASDFGVPADTTSEKGATNA